LAPEVKILPLHPNNAFLQARLELGVPGVFLVAALAALFFTGVVGGVGDRFSAAVMAGSATSYLTVASLSYGAWQNWWVSFAWALAALTALAVENKK
jgi:O-antigen ligase